MNGDLGSVASSSLDDYYRPPLQLSLPPAPAPRPPPAAPAHSRSTSFPDTPVEDDVLARMRRWMVCWASVEFNLDTGPELSSVYPPVALPKAVRSNIAFSSLPEGDLPTAGPHAYSWRIPLPPPTAAEGDEQMKELPSGGDGCLHGFVWFVQEKNDQLRRGYSQRSLVLITHLPSLSGLFSSALAVLGPMHFKHGGGGMVEAASHNVANWPDYAQGSTIDLPFLGTVLSVELPLSSQPQWPLPPTPARHGKPKRGMSNGGASSSPSLSAAPPVIPASLPPTPLSLLLSPSPSTSAFSSNSAASSNISFTKILLLWELVLLGEPILVASGDPRSGGEVVEWLRGLIRPILFAGDWRPYFHIHDLDFARLTNATIPPPATLLSTTNPLILNSCKAWPHVMRLHVRATDGKDVVRGLKSSRKRHVKCDKKVRDEVEGLMKKGDYLAADALILQHLARLTELFLAPLNRYFGTLPSSDTSLAIPASSRSFTPSAFLTSLRTHGSSLPLRPSPSFTSPSSTPMERFYARFLQSPNFASWLHERMDRAGEQVREGYLRRLEGADLRGWLDEGVEGERGEKEVDELVDRMEKEATISDALRIATNLPLPSSLPNSPSVSLLASPGGDPADRSARLRNQAARLRSLRDESRGSGASSTSAGGGESSSDDGER